MDTQISPHDSQTTSSDGPLSTQKRKRPRALLACESCRSRKLRCDQLPVCTNCSKRALECIYRELDVPLPTATYSHVQASNGQTYGNRGSHDSSVKRRVSSSASTAISKDHQHSYMPPPTSTSYNIIAPQPLNGNDRPQKVIATTIQPPGEADQGFEEVNNHTHGTEYYGPVSLFSFLKRLRSRAQVQKGYSADENLDLRGPHNARDMSIVNLLHSSDYPVTSPGSGNVNSPEHGRQPSLSSSHATPTVIPSPSSTPAGLERTNSHPFVAPFTRMSNQDIERECVRLYFINIYHIHPILDQARFLERCETDIWSQNGTPGNCTQSFLGLFYAVAAVGAIQAGEDAAFMRDTASTRQAERYAGGNADGKAPSYPPLMLAKLFFQRAKDSMPDVFESSSLEGTQTLIFMAIFCQNALKPHSCYLYMGMAVRSALAIGLPNYTGPDLVRAATTLWGLYSLEIEMCAAAGRESSLRDPKQYRIPLPHIVAPDDPKQMFQTKMIDLAHIMAELSTVTTDADFGDQLGEKSARCLEIDQKLCAWKQGLPATLNWESSSLTESEWVSKQKVVLRNRFLNTRLLVHRPFLIAAASSATPNNSYTTHVNLCVASSVLTIETLYEMYKHRRYFRTWWYNATYTLYASMVLLYVILSNIDVESTGGVDGKAYSREYLLSVVQQSVEIFQAMDMIAVARRCVEVTQEVLDIARRNSTAAVTERPPQAADPFANPGLMGAWDATAFPDFANEGLDFLIDSNLMDGLGPFSAMNGMDGSLDFMDFTSVLGASSWS